MATTPFAGLTADALDRNPWIIDALLRVGAVAHRHDAHPALADPGAPVTLGVADQGGTIPADTAINVVYTLLDADGGETMPSPVGVISTQAGLVAPDASPDLAVDHLAGTLLAGNYAYAVTILDGQGAETSLGPTITLTVPPGYAASRITVTGMAAIATDAGGAGWRLWRMIDGGQWAKIAEGSTDTVIDDGLLCPDSAVQPPTSTARTNATSLLRVTVPTGQPAAAGQFRIYASTDGLFDSPSLLGTYPIAEAGQVKEFAALDTLDGAPPQASHALPGAAKINPDTDLLDFPWKRPVATVADLPAAGNAPGDVREVLADHTLHAWDDTPGEWVVIGGGAAPPGGLPSRRTVSLQQAAMGVNETRYPTVALGRSFALLKILAYCSMQVQLRTPGADSVIVDRTIDLPNELQPLAPNVATRGTISNLDRIYPEFNSYGHYWGFRVTTAGTIDITTALVAGDAAWQWFAFLYRAGAERPSQFVAAEMMGPIRGAPVTPGDYYVTVVGADAASVGRYDITLSPSAASPAVLEALPAGMSTFRVPWAVMLAPAVVGYNGDEPPTDAISTEVKYRGQTTGDFRADFVVVPMEA